MLAWLLVPPIQGTLAPGGLVHQESVKGLDALLAIEEVRVLCVYVAVVIVFVL